MHSPAEGIWSTIPMLLPRNLDIASDGDSSTIRQGTPNSDRQHQPTNGSLQDNHTTFAITRKPVTLSSQSFNIPLGRETKATPSSPAPKRPGKHGLLSKRGSSWYLEVAGLVLSSTSFIALIAVLFYVNGRPLTQWNFFLSVNAVISTLAVISRTSLAFSISSCLGQAKWNWFKRRSYNLIGFDRFDDASRGPWGSFWLIVWLRASHWLVLGAVVTITLMAFEPFLQALISFPGQMDSVDSGLSPYIGLSQVLDVGTFVEDSDASTLGEDLPDNTPITFPYYITQPDLGMVSAFNNGFYNTSKAQSAFFYCPTANCTWPASTSLAICGTCNDVSNRLERRRQYGKNLGTLISDTSTWLVDNYTINALPLINITNLSDYHQQNQYASALMAATRITESQLTLSFQHIDTLITAVQVLRAADEYEAGTVLWDNATVTATECALYFCLNTYKSAVEGGILSEEVVSSSSDRDRASYRDANGGEMFEDYEKWHNYSLYSGPGDFNRSDLELVLPTNNTHGPSGDSTFEKAAQVLSNWVRDVSDMKSNGTAQEWVIHIHVNWPYITLPVMSIVVGLVFSLCCIFDTYRLQLDPWKTDTIATLTHSVDAETRAQLRHAYRHGYLRQAVKAMSVKFEDSESGYELRAQHL
ncbi:hypothetical protein F4775DRAFT_600778 [Biscogniauxia sp. FL1348]|nr:hypothetical protein F4775DRAFT_600778 [Biscogniauxia sp. FL1348]